MGSAVDGQLVRRKLSQLNRYLEELTTVAETSQERFVGSIVHYEAERLVELMVGVALDINFHLIKVLNLNAPAEYKASFIELSRGQVLEPTFARKIADSAGLRNLLVHHYDEVDLDRFYAGLKPGIADYRQYVAEITRFLEGNEPTH